MILITCLIILALYFKIKDVEERVNLRMDEELLDMMEEHIKHFHGGKR